MAQSGVSVSPDCIQQFNDLKLKKETKWIIYALSDDYKEIVVEETSTDPDYSKFREKLVSAKSKDKKGKEQIGARYAVFDVEFDAEGGAGLRNKIMFLSWVPDEAGLGFVKVIELIFAFTQPRMMYSTSKEALKRSLNGIAVDIQANDADDIEHENIISRVRKGR
ncbi:hypothetical protein B0A48_09487 [Cryoendolithus antarcticus]|uniref:Cofilin n=1 Tax=Cryoendolithus antarcticus TaxID=1507870 RepID=A0A1V8SZH1_9PEZI|nr:hypothetical protein B0A48_09487 [Cryoendolithus antarcticus]OQO20649.1 hypothetical protein B0A51_10656 [Rachicladosporium sp. CCFEE 5018]